MQAEKTHVEISSDIFNDKMLTIKGCYKTTLRLTYPEKQYEGTTMEVIVEKQGQETRTKTLTPGDTFTYVHEFKAEIVKDITKNHVFPITFKMDGQKYILNRTKQNKLILTK